MFPDDDHPGVDLILPDYTYVLEHADKLRGIVITHGHEDHTGTLPYLLKDLDRTVNIYATKLTLGLIEGKFAEHRVKNAKLIEIKPGDEVKLGCFTVDFFAVNHSIPGAVGLFIQSPAGNVLHTGDFKLDQTPIDGITTDFGALARFSETGVDLMMSDSTNATNPNFTPSEAEVGKTLEQIISQAKGRVIIASFASHIHRMQQICDAAVKNGRKVVVTGRSMIQNTDIARRLGYLNISDDNLIDAYDLKGIPPEQVVIMCTGSQGEPLSASGPHRQQASTRPSRWRRATRSSSRPRRFPATRRPSPEGGQLSWPRSAPTCTTRARARVHVSGHAGAEELKIMLSIVTAEGRSCRCTARPRTCGPTRRLAEAAGVDLRTTCSCCENGECLELSARRASSAARACRRASSLVDGLSVGDTSEEVLDERNGAFGYQGFAAIGGGGFRRT